MALDRTIAELAWKQYARERDRYEKLSEAVRDECVQLVEKAGIQAHVTYRAKEPSSFYKKLLRYIETNPSDARVVAIESPSDAMAMIGDLAAVRVATYVEGDRDRMVDLVDARFGFRSGERTVDIDRKNKPSGYRATHCQVLLPKELSSLKRMNNVADTSVEIQVCSMLAHVWNEIEHDVRYKVGIDWGSEEAYRNTLLDEFRESTLAGDSRIERVLGLRSELIAKALVSQIEQEFSSVKRFGENSVEVVKEFVRLGFDQVEKINATSGGVARLQHSYELIGRINTALQRYEAPAECQLNPLNADVLLALLLEAHCWNIDALYVDRSDGSDGSRIAKVARAIVDSEVFGPNPRR